MYVITENITKRPVLLINAHISGAHLPKSCIIIGDMSPLLPIPNDYDVKFENDFM